MNFAENVIRLRIVFFTLTGVLLASGVLSYFTMPIEEDPRLKERNGVLSIVYPGANAREIERLIVQPVEDQLAEIGEIKSLEITSRPQVMIARIELKDSLSSDGDINEAWRDIRVALDRAERDFPEGVEEYELNRNVTDLEAIVLAVTGSDDRLLLRDTAERLKTELLRLPNVSGVTIVTDPGEEISIEIDDRVIREKGLSYQSLSNQLFESNRAIPAGAVRMGELGVSVRTNSSFADLNEIQEFPVLLDSGEIVALGQLARVARTTELPQTEDMFVDGRPAVGLGVIPLANINLVDFGTGVRGVIADFQKRLNQNATGAAPLKIETVNFQPDYVADRIAGLGFSLFSGITIVAGVLILAMGFRIGFLTALLVPVISVIALGIYAAGDGVLQQISIAAFVLALGLLIDNVIVIVESIQEQIDAGEDITSAAISTVKNFALPLATATGTTVAAFLPMFGASGGTADFTRSIPLIAMLTLTVSYFFSILVTPSLAIFGLKPGTARAWNFTLPLGDFLGDLIFRRPLFVLACALSVLGLSALSFVFVQSKFFPAADRNQVVLDVSLPEGTHFRTTRERAFALSEKIREVPGVTKVSTFVGRSTPQFYYNLVSSPRSPHVAQAIVELESFELAPPLRGKLEAIGREMIFDGTVIVRELQQGPPTRAPIEVRVIDDDHASAGQAANRIVGLLRQIEGTDAVRSDFGQGVPNLKFTVGDANSLQYGLARSQVTSVLLGRTRGLEVGQYRAGEDPIPIMLRSSKGEELGYEELYGAYVGRTRVADVNIGDVSAPELEWQPAVINHRDGRRMVRVLAETLPGYSVGPLLAEFQNRLPQLELAPSIKVEYGGEEAESGQANQAIARALPAGMALLLVSLLLEFRSFKKVAIILIAIPLAIIGVAPGLVLAGQPFGFLSLLGSLALAGIVANNGILLIDALDGRVKAGAEATAALQYAIGRRLRPILLTTLTTIMGLLPLALTSATLWPPFAWAIISGLTLSTLLTILVIPALYRLWLMRGATPAANDNGSGPAVFAAPLTVLAFAAAIALPSASAFAQNTPSTSPANSQTLPIEQNQNDDGTEAGDSDDAIGPTEAVALKEVLLASSRAPLVRGSYAEADAATSRAEALSRSTYFPKVGAGLSYEWRDRKIPGPSFLGVDVGGEPRQFPQASIEITQPLLDPANMWYYVPAAEERAEAATLDAKRRRQTAMAEGANRYFDSLRLRIRLRTLKQFQRTLYQRSREIRRLFEFGRVAELDLLKVNLALDDARQAVLELNASLPVADLALGRAMGYTTGVVPAAPEELPAQALPEYDASRRLALEQRIDLQALNVLIRAKKTEIEGIQYEALPRLFAKGQWTYIDNGLLQEDNWFSFSLGMTMPIFEGGTRKVRKDALLAELTALESQRTDALQGIGVQIREAISGIRTGRADLARSQTAVNRAYRTVRLEAQRYRRGQGQFNDLLDAENVLRERREKRDLARIDFLAAWIRYELAVGQEPGSII